MPSPRDAYVKGASERFHEAWKGIEAKVKKVFPKAEPLWTWDLPGWKVPLPKKAVPAEQQGTMPNDHLYILLADRANGPTLHFWNPVAYTFLDERADWLKEAGFKPMKGCLPFTRKQPYPVAAVERLCKEAKASWK